MSKLASLALWPVVLAAAAAAADPAGPEQAQATPAAPPPAASAPEDPFRLQLLFESAPEAAFGDADVSWQRAVARLRVGGAVSERTEVTLRLASDYVQYDFDGDEGFLDAGQPGAPFDDLIENSVRLGAGFRVRDSWLVVGEGYLESKLERGADVGDSLKGGVLLGVGYRQSSELEAMLGVKLGTQLDHDGLSAWPSLRVRWRIDDRWRLAFNNGDLSLECEISERWTLSASAAFQTDRFRLADRRDGPAGVGEGSLGHWRVPVALGVEWKPLPRFGLRASAGAVAWQRFKVNDQDGDEFDTATADPAAPFFALEATARF